MYERLRICFPEHNVNQFFQRGEWRDVPTKVAELILNANRFFETEDFYDFRRLITDQNKKFAFVKTYALGDIIMLIPFFRHIRKNSTNKVFLITANKYVGIFKNDRDLFDGVLSPAEYNKSMFDKIINMDAIEEDHTTVGPNRLIHRVKISEKYLKLTLGEYDFSIKTSPQDRRIVEEMLNALAKQNEVPSDNRS
jgi:hypothetical protein